jgi:hypothetical protein
LTQRKKELGNSRGTFRISLRALLVLMTILCLWFGKISIAAHKQKKAVEWVEANGGRVKYDWQSKESAPKVFPGPAPVPDAKIPGPKWLRRLIGEDYFQTVLEVNLTRCNIADISPLTNLPEVEFLESPMNHIRDLTPLQGLSHLRTLGLYQNEVEDSSPIAGIRTLGLLLVGENRISDIGCLAGMQNLESVAIQRNPLSRASALFTVPKLKDVFVSAGQLSNEEVHTLREKGVRVNIAGDSDSSRVHAPTE